MSEVLRPVKGPLLARQMHFGASGQGTPYVSYGDSARVLFFMNLSGAYNGYAGKDQAMADAKLFSAAPDLLAALQSLDAIGLEKGAEPLLAGLMENARAAIKKATS